MSNSEAPPTHRATWTSVAEARAGEWTQSGESPLVQAENKAKLPVIAQL